VRTALALFPIALASLVLTGCSDSSSAPRPPGTLVISNTATGPVLPGPDYIHIRLDTGLPIALRVDSTLTIADVAAGPLTVHADLLRPQCSVPTADVPITVSPTDTARLHFSITCHVIWGVVVVALPTSGLNQPSALYVSIDGHTVGGASPNTTGLGFPYITAGSRSIGLSGFGGNCALAEPNPQTVLVPLNDTIHVTFSLDCS
jgi:hypothetical protein